MILIDNQAVLAVIAKGRSVFFSKDQPAPSSPCCPLCWPQFVPPEQHKGQLITQQMLPQGSLMVIGQITKQQRKAERQELGRLQDLVAKKGTLEKYHSHFNRFCDWAEANGFPLLAWILRSLRQQHHNSSKAFGQMVLVRRKVLIF